MKTSDSVAWEGVNTTRTLSVLVIAVALSLCAVWVHLPGREARPNALQNGSFNPLVKAERLVGTGRANEALEFYQVAFTRAVFQGWNGVSELIRRRLAAVGKALINKDGETAWGYLESYALLSKNFNESAIRVEALYLNNPKVLKTRFVYRCAPFESRWIDSIKTNWTPLWKWNRLPRKGDAVMPGADLAKYRMREWPVKTFATGVRGQLLERYSPFPTTVQVECNVPPGSACVIVTSGRSCRVQTSPNGKWSFKGYFTRPHGQIVRVLVFSDKLPPPTGPSVSLVHEYKPL